MINYLGKINLKRFAVENDIILDHLNDRIKSAVSETEEMDAAKEKLCHSLVENGFHQNTCKALILSYISDNMIEEERFLPEGEIGGDVLVCYGFDNNKLKITLYDRKLRTGNKINHNGETFIVDSNDNEGYDPKHIRYSDFKKFLDFIGVSYSSKVDSKLQESTPKLNSNKRASAEQQYFLKPISGNVGNNDSLYDDVDIHLDILNGGFSDQLFRLFKLSHFPNFSNILNNLKDKPPKQVETSKPKKLSSGMR